MKRIGFVGGESADIALYLARLLQNNSSNVVAIDHTKRYSLMRNAGIPDELTGKSGMYRGIEIFSESAACKFRDNAVIVDYFSYSSSHEDLMKCDIVVFVSDMLPYNAMSFKEIKVREDAEKFLILRDAIPLKYSEKFLVKETGQNIPKDRLFVIPYDELDYRSRCYLCIDKKHKLSGLSEPMKRTILSLYMFSEKVELKRKEIAYLMKHA